MNKLITRNRTGRIRYLLSALLIAGTAVAGPVLGTAPASAAGNDTIYVTPNTGSFTVGQRFKVEIRANSNAEQVNAVQVNLGYTTSVLGFYGIDYAGSDYDVDAQRSGGHGGVTVAKGSTKPLVGDKLVARVEFVVTGAGTGNIEVKNSSVLVSHATNKNIADSRIGASFSGFRVPSPGPPGPAGPPGSPGAVPRPQPIPTTRPIPVPDVGEPPNVTISPEPTTTEPEPQPIILPDESEIEVEQPSVIETTPSTEKTVQKVEYYINGKLVMTVNEPPYSYSVDTSKMRNGTYTLTTKTLYEDGSEDSVDAALVVSNPMNATQLMLQLKHFAWLVVLIVLIIVGLIWFKFFRNRGGGDDEFGGDMGASYPPADGGMTTPPYGPPPASSVIPPNPAGQPYDPNNPNGPPPPTNPYSPY